MNNCLEMTQDVVGYTIDTAPKIRPAISTSPENNIDSSQFSDSSVESQSRMKKISSSRPNVLRRLKGFLIEIIGSEAKVCFVDGGVAHEYYMPAHPLQKANIKSENQPFEMDEIEIYSTSGYIAGYEYRALAKPADAFEESFKLDPEREEKRDLIFRALKNAKA